MLGEGCVTDTCVIALMVQEMEKMLPEEPISRFTESMLAKVRVRDEAKGATPNSVTVTFPPPRSLCERRF